MKPITKGLAGVAALVVAASLALSGCSSNSPNSPGASGSGGQPSVVLSFGKPDGQLANNSSPFAPTSAAKDLGYLYAIYEPLVIANTIDPTQAPIPWLASAYKWNTDYTSITFTVRDNVKWTDGQPLTADDVAYSIQIRKDNQALNGEALPYKDITTSGNTVTVTFTDSQYVNTSKVYGLFVIPKHIWDVPGKDLMTDLNQNPVGTGPYILKSWTQQAVILTANPNYWGGVPAVQTIQYQSFNDNTALTNALVAGQVQWGWGYIANYKTVFTDKDPAYRSWFPSGLGMDAMWLNCAKGPFADVTLRKAVSMIIDRQVLSTSGSTGAAAPLTSVTGLPESLKSYISSDYQGQTFSVDVDGAKALLTQAGYTGVGTALTDPKGNKVSVTISVPAGWNDYQAELQLIGDAMKKDLGMDVNVQNPTADTWGDNVNNGNFDAVLHWTDGGPTPFNLYSSIMNGSYLVPIGQQANYNYGRFDSKDATAALQTYANASSDADRTAAMATIEKIFVEQVPAIPLLERPSWGQYSEKYYTGWPGPDNPYADINMTLPSATLVLTKLKPVS